MSSVQRECKHRVSREREVAQDAGRAVRCAAVLVQLHLVLQAHVLELQPVAGYRGEVPETDALRHVEMRAHDHRIQPALS